MRNRFLSARLPISVTLAVWLLVGSSCDGGPLGIGGTDEMAPIHVTAFAVGTPVSTLVIEVTADDIKKRLVFNVEVIDGVASGTIEVPSGEGRTFSVTAYDDHHNVTHTGSATMDVRPGNNPPLQVKLKPEVGEVDVTVTFGDYGVLVTPSAVEFVAIGATEQLVVTVLDQYGEEVADAQVQWATTHPTIASVSQSGLVTALAEGEAAIVASYAGVAGISEITVTDVAGQEVCDGIDNNGDGQVDEGFAYCIDGVAAPNSDGENSCLDGWGDLDGDPTNGCESDVTTGPEICDFIDNDGDGAVDEDLLYCQFGGIPAPNTDGEYSCLDGWYDLDGDPLNGCETEQPLACPTSDELTTADLINAERAAQGLGALEVDVRLVVAAQGHSADMEATGNLSHTGSDGSSFVDRVNAAGYPSPGGEVIARYFGGGTPEEVVALWMGSQSHRDLLLSPNFTHVGVGVSGEFWTTDFGLADVALPPRSSCGGG